MAKAAKVRKSVSLISQFYVTLGDKPSDRSGKPEIWPFKAPPAAGCVTSRETYVDFWQNYGKPQKNLKIT